MIQLPRRLSRLEAEIVLLRLTAAIWTLVLTVSGQAECVRRPFTDAERAFVRATLDSIRQALPVAPPGWRFEDLTLDRAPVSGCVDSGPLQFAYQAVYHAGNGGKQQQMESENTRRAPESNHPTPEVRKRIRDLESQAADRLRQLPRAVSDGNLKLAEKLSTEARQLTAEANDLKRKNRAETRTPQPPRPETEREQSSQVRVSVAVNEPPPGGVSGIARREDGATLVFQAGTRAKPRLAIHALVIHLIGDPPHVNALLNSWDTARLRRMAAD